MIGPEFYRIAFCANIARSKNYKTHLVVLRYITLDIFISSCVFTTMTKGYTADGLSAAVYMYLNGAKLRNVQKKYPDITK
jgi:hypothetical protein